MIGFGYEYLAEKNITPLFVHAIAYVFDGVPPANLAHGNINAYSDEANDLYNRSLGFMEITTNKPVTHVTDFKQMPSSGYNTKGWHLHEDGKWYCYPDSILTSDMKCNNDLYLNATFQRLYTPVKGQGSRTISTDTNIKTLDMIFDEEQTMDCFSKDVTIATGKLLYWDSVGSVWVEIMPYNAAAGNYVFPSAVTSTKFRIQEDYYASASSGTWEDMRFGSTVEQTNAATTRTASYIIIIPVQTQPDTVWKAGGERHQLLLGVSEPNGGGIALFENSAIAKGDVINMVQCSITYKGMGNDTI